MKNQNISIHNHSVCACVCAWRRVTKAARNLKVALSRISLAISATVPVITVHSTGNVTRGKTGSFVLVSALGKTAEDMKPALMFGGMYVNFKVSGTAIAGVDYVLLVSPAYIGRSGYGVIQVKTLPDPRGSSSRQALQRYSNPGTWRRI